MQNQRICEPGVWVCVTAPSQTWGPRESTCWPPKSPVCPGDGGRVLGWSSPTKGAMPPHPALLGLQPPEPRGLVAFQACLAGVTSGTCPCSPAENSTSPVLHLVSVSSCLFPSLWQRTFSRLPERKGPWEGNSSSTHTSESPYSLLVFRDS